MTDRRTLLNSLSGETGVLPGLLVECDELVEAIKSGKPYPELLDIINENF